MPLDRRDFVKSLTASFALPGMTSALADAAGSAGPAHAPRQKSPNAILMICDDLGYGDLGCYGSKLPTPNLDAMAAAGVGMTHFNSAPPICSPSRSALFTGR